MAEELNKKFRYEDKGVFVASLHQYYAKNGQREWLMEQGYSDTDIGTHAAMRDSSEILALAPNVVRSEMVCDGVWGDKNGAHGRATLATAEIGQRMLQLKIDAAVNQIRTIETHMPMKH